MMSSKKHAGEERATPEVTAVTFTIGGEELAVISLPAIRTVEFPELTDAENEVVHLVLSGLSNAEIAAARGTSIHTVVNQVSAVFRKLQITSRSELVVMARR